MTSSLIRHIWVVLDQQLPIRQPLEVDNSLACDLMTIGWSRRLNVGNAVRAHGVVEDVVVETNDREGRGGGRGRPSINIGRIDVTAIAGAFNSA
jgi:hypothetical protein